MNKKNVAVTIFRNAELLGLLISEGIDVDSQSDAGAPLTWAAGHGQQDAVKVLLEQHANVCWLLALHSQVNTVGFFCQYSKILTVTIVMASVSFLCLKYALLSMYIVSIKSSN